MSDVHFHVKFALKVPHPPPFKNSDFDQYLLVTSEMWKLAKNVQLLQIKSRPHAFQQAIDKVRTLPLTPPNGSSKREFVAFVNKIQVQ